MGRLSFAERNFISHERIQMTWVELKLKAQGRHYLVVDTSETSNILALTLLPTLLSEGEHGTSLPTKNSSMNTGTLPETITMEGDYLNWTECLGHKEKDGNRGLSLQAIQSGRKSIP